MQFIVRWQLGGHFDIQIIDEREGQIVFKASGKNAFDAFKNEPGGHRWQEVSGNKIHTSTITIAVLPAKELATFKIKDSDLNWDFSRGTGAGGQHKNKTDTCVKLTHIPSGISVRIDGRSQAQNKVKALSVLSTRVAMSARSELSKERAAKRKGQHGSGQRGDKVRTIRVKDGIVTNHITKRKTSYKKYCSGNFSELF